MNIQIGAKIPSTNVQIASNDGPQNINTDELFAGGKIALFCVPGAFTPTCSAKHLPGFIENYDSLIAAGINKIICMSVNDAFVMYAWGKSAEIGDKIVMLADGNGDFTAALGLELNGRAYGLGKRAQRFSMIVENGIVTHLFIEASGEFRVSSAQFMLENI
jgi:glutaredoxin/glutathione-dependent peroxiredoxin